MVSMASRNDVLNFSYHYLKPNSLTLRIIQIKLFFALKNFTFSRFSAHLHRPYAVHNAIIAPLPLYKSPTQIVHNVTNLFTYLTHDFTTPYSLDFHANLKLFNPLTNPTKNPEN